MEKIKEEIIVSNSHGLHARPAAIFVQIAKKYDASVHVERNDEVVDGKSIIAILSLGIHKGMSVRLIIEGIDASSAYAELKKFLESNND